jgi:hypothetical protein
VVKRVTTSCFFKDQETAPEFMRKAYPDVLFLSFWSPA